MIKYSNAQAGELEAIREQLYQSSHIDIAEGTGYSQRYVFEVLNGRRRNQLIVDAAKKLIELHRENIRYMTINFHRSLKEAKQNENYK